MIDNESVKYALIKSLSGEATSGWITHQYWHQEVELECSSWLDRAPSERNCADGPSRGALRAAEFLKGSVDVKPIPSSLYEQFVNERGRMRA